jgi:hypothetical protein
MRKTQ